MGWGIRVPLHAMSHMGRAPQTKKPACLGPGVPLSGSTEEMELKRVSLQGVGGGGNALSVD